MLQLVTVPGDPNQTFSSELGGYKYRFSLWWSEEVQAWWLSTTGLTVDFNLLGQRLSPGFDLWRPHRKSLGSLFVSGPEYDPITLDGLGDTHRIYWASRSEVNAL